MTAYIAAMEAKPTSDSVGRREEDSLRQDVFRAAAALAGKGEYGTLVLDGFGKIRSCGTAAAHMLGCGLADVAGRSISDFVADFAVSGSSASYGARYLAYLCSDGGWRRFTVVDARGNRFPAELALSKVVTDGQDYFLLNLRRMEPGGT